MDYYLLDTCAVVHSIENLSTLRKDIYSEKAVGNCFLYIPQFCVPEVFNTFARFFFRDKKVKPDQYNIWRNHFINLVHDRKIFYCYDLHRYHNLNCHLIFRTEHTTPYSLKEKALSSFDILVIAMGIELKTLHPKDNVKILTRDSRLLRIANSSKKFAPAEWFD